MDYPNTGDSGGPLMIFNTSQGQYVQVGIVSGGVSHCGNTDIPDIYVRLDHPEVAGFIGNPDDYVFEETTEVPELQEGIHI
jgi:secreted trypsin-like serine protease